MIRYYHICENFFFVMCAYTATFSCPSLPSTATTQPTPPPPNPTTESEETPPTTNQQTQEPVDPLTTSDRPATDFEGATGAEPKVPTASETATDLPILSPSESNDVGLVIGIVVVILVVIALAVTVVVIIAILLKRRGNIGLNKTRALSNPTYSAKGQYNKNAI